MSIGDIASFDHRYTNKLDNHKITVRINIVIKRLKSYDCYILGLSLHNLYIKSLLDSKFAKKKGICRLKMISDTIASSKWYEWNGLQFHKT